MSVIAQNKSDPTRITVACFRSFSFQRSAATKWFMQTRHKNGIESTDDFQNTTPRAGSHHYLNPRMVNAVSQVNNLEGFIRDLNHERTKVHFRRQRGPLILSVMIIAERMRHEEEKIQNAQGRVSHCPRGQTNRDSHKLKEHSVPRLTSTRTPQQGSCKVVLMGALLFCWRTAVLMWRNMRLTVSLGGHTGSVVTDYPVPGKRSGTV